MIRTSLRLAGVAVLAVALVSAAAAPAVAGAAPKLRVAKHSTGPYHEVVSANLADGERKVFFYKAKSSDGQTSDATLAENDGLGNEYSVKYKRNGHNISQAVQTIGYEFTISPKVKRFKVIIGVESGPPSPGCLLNELQSFGGESFTGIQVNTGNCT